MNWDEFDERKASAWTQIYIDDDDQAKDVIHVYQIV